MKTSKLEDDSGFSMNIFSVIIEITCPICGFGIDIWNDESETRCRLCGYAPFNHEKIMN